MTGTGRCLRRERKKIQCCGINTDSVVVTRLRAPRQNIVFNVKIATSRLAATALISELYEYARAY